MPDFAGKAEESRFAKITLRNRLLTARRTLSAADHTAAALAVHTATTTLVRQHHPSTAAAYVPMGAEPGGPGLPDALATALPDGGRLLLPVLRPDLDLDWAAHSPGALASGPKGLSEPSGPRLGVDAVRQAELLIVPALAVGRDGTRLGRGGGSYDRALARATGALLVALLHDGELLDSVPAEPHDIAVHAVITPSDGLVVLRHF